MRSRFRTKDSLGFFRSPRGMRLLRLFLLALLLVGLCAVSIAQDAMEAPALPERVRDGLQVASEAIMAERSALSAPFVIYGYRFHQDNWGTPAMAQEYGTLGIDNCVSNVPLMRKRSEIVLGWNFTIADMSCNVYYARVSLDRSQSALCDEVALSPNLSPEGGAAAGAIELLRDVQSICGNIFVEATPGDEMGKMDEMDEMGKMDEMDEMGEMQPTPDTSSGRRSTRVRNINLGGSDGVNTIQPVVSQPTAVPPNEPETNTDDTKPRCPQHQVGWNSRNMGMGSGNYKVVTTTDANGCVTKTVRYTGGANTDSPGHDLAIRVVGDEDCLNSDVDNMLMQSGEDGSTLGDVLMVDC